MKKMITFALASVMTLASSMLVLADAEPVAAITTTYTFDGAAKAIRNDTTVDEFNNPFKDGGYDVMSIQYTVTIPDTAFYLTGYDTVMTFGTSADGFLYVCNELVGANNGQFGDYWPSGELGKLNYPGKGSTYTVNLVFTKDGVAFYKDGEAQPGSNVSVANADGTAGTLTGEDFLNILNEEEVLYIGDNNTSYWMVQDMILSNIVFFKGEQKTPYTLAGTEAKAVRVGEEAAEQDTTKKGDDKPQQGVVEITTAPETTTPVDPNADEGETKMLTVVMIIVIVVIVLALGVSAMVIMTSKRRR